jgi:predicted DNA-binding ribbon-helix-helix protein
MQQSTIVKRSVRVAGHATSISLEAAFWRGLCDIAAARGLSVNALVAAIDASRGGNLSSAIRLFVLDCARSGELTSAELTSRRADDSLAPSA